MPRVYLGLGSNQDRERHLRQGYAALLAEYGQIALSPVYEGESVGFAGSHFLNLVAAIDTDLPLAQLAATLRAIEEAHGRRRNSPKFSPRTLDIDILTYGDQSGCIAGIQLPRAEILTNAFVLQPFADLAGDFRHPLTGLTMAEHWVAYDKSSQRLWRVPFSWS